MSLRVGLMLGNKQRQWEESLKQHAVAWGLERGLSVTVEAVDPDTIEQQRFDVVLHKLCRHFALAPTDPGVARELNAVSAYFATHPSVPFDPLEAVRDLNNRDVLFSKLAGFDVAHVGQHIVTPPFHALYTRDDCLKVGEQLSFALPWIHKPVVADGIPESHDLAMVLSAQGLRQASVPCVLQPFYNHDAQIVKLYVLGDTVSQLRRPSLPNMQPSVPLPPGAAAFVPFGRISNAGSGKESDCQVAPEDAQTVPLLSDEALRRVVAELRARLQVTLFGVDLIRDCETGDYLIIDVNYLPGYYGVTDVFPRLLDVMLARTRAQ